MRSGLEFRIAALILCFSGALSAASVGATAISPASIDTGTPSTITITSSITDEGVIASTVNLQRLDAAGRVVAVVGNLHDDGLQGDATPNDKTFSLRFSALENTPGSIRFRVSAGFAGSLTRVFSSPVTLTISGTGTGIQIAAPANLQFLNTSPVIVNGTFGDPGATIKVNGLNATKNGTSFQLTVPLVEGNNTLIAVASNTNGSTSTASVQVTLDTKPPTVTILSPEAGASTAEGTTTVTGIVNDIVVGTVNDRQATVTVNGITAVVVNRTFTATNVPLSVGANVLQAVARDQVGNSATASLSFTRVAPPTLLLKKISGDNQSGVIGTQLAQPLVVQLLNGVTPVPNASVVFKVTENDGYVLPGVNKPASIAVVTNAQGRAQANFVLGTRSGAGNNLVEASAVGFTGVPVFVASGQPQPASKVNVDSGNNQIGTVGQALSLPFVAIVTDPGNNRVGGVPVTFTVKNGGGTIAGVNTVTATSDSDGRALATLALGSQPGPDSNIVEATFTGNKGLPASFTATSKVPGNVALTRITGIVLDNSNNPIQNVTMRLFLTNQGGANNQPVQVGTPVVTNAQGFFNIQPAPVGFFKLMADGFTAGNAQKSYPTLEYDMVTIAGQENTLGMPIYLPVLDQLAKVCVNESTGGVLTSPKLPGFSLTIAPGGATFPGGSRVGCVTVSGVNADKVPMTPGFGQQPRFIVTIQPVGTTFNPAAAITIPNIDGLAPRSKTEMYSYDHDLAAFVAIGSATVSDDGSVIASDPGVGVLKAGWHCGGNPNAAGGAQPVKVDITTPGPITLATNATSTVGASGNPAPGTYSWVSSDPAKVQITGGASSASVTIKGLASGMATLTVTYTCESGASDTETIQVNVSGITVVSVAPNPMVIGTDGDVNYKIEPGGSYDTVKLEIRNAANTLVFKAEGLPTGAGTHNTKWTAIKWNQAPNAGAFANPKNGPYQFKIIGTKNGAEETDTKSGPIKLVLEADIKDEKPAGSTVSRTSGLSDLIAALKIVMKLGGAETVVSGAGAITVTGAAQDVKQIKVDAAPLNSLADGNYEVLFRDLRDVIGNFSDTDNNPANGIQPIKFNVNLR